MTASTSQDFTRGASSSRRKLTGVTSLLCATKGLRVGATTSEIASLARAWLKAVLPTRPVAPNSKSLMVALSPPLTRCVVPSGSNYGSHLTLRHDSDLRKSTVHKNLRPGDIATLIRCEKHHSPSDFIRSAKPAKWDCAGDHLAPLLTCFARCEQIIQAGRVDGARADALTRIRRCLRSVVHVLAKERMDAFVALYTLFEERPLLPTTEALRMTDAPSGIRGTPSVP